MIAGNELTECSSPISLRVGSVQMILIGCGSRVLAGQLVMKDHITWCGWDQILSPVTFMHNDEDHISETITSLKRIISLKRITFSLPDRILSVISLSTFFA